MTKHKTSELAGAQLDAAVAKAEGYIGIRIAKDGVCYVDDLRCVETHYPPGGGYEPSSNWGDGGPIIERERIAIGPGHYQLWRAQINEGGAIGGRILNESSGPTPLIAAMRCYVASKFGDEVDL